MLTKKIAAILLTTSLILSACSSSPKIAVNKTGDNELTKQEILKELDELTKIEQQIDKKKGLNGTNVASVAFFWPGLIYTYVDANDAQKKVDKRRETLNKIYNKKFESNRQAAR